MPLIAAGAGMLASRSPFPGVAVGEGLLTGLKVAGTQTDREYKADLAEARATSASNLANIRSQSVDQQGRHLAQMGDIAAQKLAAQTDAQNARNDAAQQKLLQGQQLIDIKGQAAKDIDEVRRQNAETREKAAQKYQWQFGPGQDPNSDDPTKLVQGSWRMPTTDTNEQPKFFPNQGASRQGNTAFKSKQRAFLAIPGNEGKAQEALDFASGKRALSPAEWAHAVQAEENSQRAAWTAANPIGGTPPNFRGIAEQRVQGTLGNIPGSSSAAPKAVVPPAAPQQPPKPPDQATAIAGAKAAIASQPGVRDAVIAQMRAWGYDPSGL